MEQMTHDGPRWIEHGDHLVTWLANPSEPLRRASHAMRLDGRWYLVDPLDTVDLDDRLVGLGGIVVLFERHWRDARLLANRYDVPIYRPRAVDADDDAIDDAETVLSHMGFEAIDLSGPLWNEIAYWRATDGTLLVAETLGTAPHFRAAGERIGIHPLRRLLPPRDALSDIEASRVLVGHGEPIGSLETSEIDRCLAAARRHLPGAWINGVKAWL